jgi:hypothetical protein
MAPPGPARLMALPLAKNSPVPIAPPIAIMLNCREPMPRFSSCDSFEVIELSRGCEVAASSLNQRSGLGVR